MDEKEYNNQLKYAMDLFKLRDFEKAAEVFKQLLETDSKNPHLYNNIGLCYAHEGQNEKAEEYYKNS